MNKLQGYSSNIGDEFEFFNSSKWNVVVTGTPYNNELQYYRDNDENYRVEKGALIITPLKKRFVYSLKYLKLKLDANFKEIKKAMALLNKIAQKITIKNAKALFFVLHHTL